MATSDDSALYVGSCDTTQPEDSDAPSKGAAEIRQVKIQNKTSFPNVTGAVTATHTELNYVDGVTSAIQTQLDAKFASADVIDEDNMASDSDTKVPTQQSTKAYVDTEVGAVIPSGAVMPFAMESAPSGWLECDGSAVNRTTYADLFTAIGTSFGYGDQSTTFNVPDLRGQFIRGWDHTAGTDPNAGTRTASGTGGATGDNVGSGQDDEFESHTHDTSLNQFNLAIGGYTSGSTSGSAAYNTLATGGDETRPKNVYMMYCIKT